MKGFDKYYERINLVNFFKENDKMWNELENLKKDLKPKVGLQTESGRGGIYKVREDSDAKLDSKRSRKKKQAFTKRPPTSSSSESSSSIEELPKVEVEKVEVEKVEVSCYVTEKDLHLEKSFDSMIQSSRVQVDITEGNETIPEDIQLYLSQSQMPPAMMSAFKPD